MPRQFAVPIAWPVLAEPSLPQSIRHRRGLALRRTADERQSRRPPLELLDGSHESPRPLRVDAAQMPREVVA